MGVYFKNISSSCLFLFSLGYNLVAWARSASCRMLSGRFKPHRAPCPWRKNGGQVNDSKHYYYLFLSNIGPLSPLLPLIGMLKPCFGEGLWSLSSKCGSSGLPGIWGSCISWPPPHHHGAPRLVVKNMDKDKKVKDWNDNNGLGKGLRIGWGLLEGLAWQLRLRLAWKRSQNQRAEWPSSLRQWW